MSNHGMSESSNRGIDKNVFSKIIPRNPSGHLLMIEIILSMAIIIHHLNIEFRSLENEFKFNYCLPEGQTRKEGC